MSNSVLGWCAQETYLILCANASNGIAKLYGVELSSQDDAPTNILSSMAFGLPCTSLLRFTNTTNTIFLFKMFLLRVMSDSVLLGYFLRFSFYVWVHLI